MSFIIPKIINTNACHTLYIHHPFAEILLSPKQMWIYSLGITLHKAIPTSGITPTNRIISGSLMKINNDRENDDVAIETPVPSTAISTDMTMYHHYQHHSNKYDKMLTSLDCVISAMCAPKLCNRASLMYLLDVSSPFFIFI